MLTRKERGEGGAVEKSSHVLMYPISHLRCCLCLERCPVCMACTARPVNVLRFRETRDPELQAVIILKL
jgi:hypothetical protein